VIYPDIQLVDLSVYFTFGPKRLAWFSIIQFMQVKLFSELNRFSAKRINCDVTRMYLEECTVNKVEPPLQGIDMVACVMVR
jgi:hypothetical protein